MANEEKIIGGFASELEQVLKRAVTDMERERLRERVAYYREHGVPDDEEPDNGTEE